MVIPIVPISLLYRRVRFCLFHLLSLESQFVESGKYERWQWFKPASAIWWAFFSPAITPDRPKSPISAFIDKNNRSWTDFGSRTFQNSEGLFYLGNKRTWVLLRFSPRVVLCEICRIPFIPKKPDRRPLRYEDVRLSLWLQGNWLNIEIREQRSILSSSEMQLQ
jgi:hypothetical protein